MDRPKRPQERPKGLQDPPKRPQEAPKRPQERPKRCPRGPKRPQEEPKGKRKREEIGPKRLSEHHLLKNVNFHEACVKPTKFDNFKRKGNERTRAEQMTRAKQV